MKQQEFDTIYGTLLAQNRKLDALIVAIDNLTVKIQELNTKTIVVSDVTKQLENIKVTVDSLADEIKEM